MYKIGDTRNENGYVYELQKLEPNIDNHAFDYIVRLSTDESAHYIIANEGCKEMFEVVTIDADYPAPIVESGRMDINFYAWIVNTAEDVERVAVEPTEELLELSDDVWCCWSWTGDRVDE